MIKKIVAVVGGRISLITIDLRRFLIALKVRFHL